MSGSFSPDMFGAPIASFAVTWMVLTLLLRAWSDRILDQPNERSLHQQPVPRTGGVGVAAGIAVGVSLVSPWEWWPLWIAASLLIGVSFLDDLVGLPVIGRLMAHFLVAGWLVSELVLGQIGIIWSAVVIIAVVWMINLYNFMDGMDGLAGGMAVLGFGFLAVAAWLNGNAPLALVNASIVASAGAFLFFNVHPARIFLGDAGSTTLGFLAAGVGILGCRDGVWSVGFPILVFSPFIIDSTVTLLRRMLRAEKFWQAHRAHCYQRLVLSGWGQRRTFWAEGGLMLFCGLVALLYQWLSECGRMVLLVLCAVMFIVLVKGVDKIQCMKSEKLP
jgi:UDP-GlcNAc:undecaprenyl-phosphate GlcNAc-1-phosphate transferase